MLRNANPKFLVPNVITALNMFLGFTAVNIAIDGDFTKAIWVIWGAGFLDLLDGRLARAMNASTRFGIEFDSLSDLVAFGVAPSILLYQVFFMEWDFPGTVIAFLPALCGALRLARYNVEWGTKDKRFIKGMSIPIAALTLSSYVAFADKVWGGYEYPALAALIVVVVCSLMVSTIRFESHNKSDSGKVIDGAKAAIFLIGCISILLLGLHVMFLWSIVYVSLALYRWGIEHRPGRSSTAVST